MKGPQKMNKKDILQFSPSGKEFKKETEKNHEEI
jgi:hypothetical protein